MHAEGAARSVATLLLLVGALGSAAPASGWCQMTTSRRRPSFGEPCVLPREGEYPLAWRRRCTSISLSTMGSSTISTELVRAVLRQSIDTWVSVECSGVRTGLEVTILPELNACTRASHYTDGRNVHSLIFVPSGWVEERMHDARAYAVTLVWHDPQSGEIWDADIEMNEERRPYGICPEDACPVGTVDLQNVLTHEIGHYFGLAHTPHDSLATMWAMAIEGETLKRDLQPDDIAGLCAIYAPGTLPDGCDTTPRGGLALDCQAPGCGCAIPGRARRPGGGFAVLAIALVSLAAIGRRSLSRTRSARGGGWVPQIASAAGAAHSSPTP